MNTSLNWIKEYVPDLNCSAQEYTDRMTLSGTKVEGYECLSEDLDKIVVGQILSIDKHPDADKLVICKVDIGRGEPIQIVTGAPNVVVNANPGITSCTEHFLCFTKLVLSHDASLYLKRN